MPKFYCFRNSKNLFLFILPFISLTPLLVSATIVNNLSVGSQGEEVKELQMKLIDLGYLSTTATGYFGQATKNAVTRYQKDSNITASGYVGPITRASLQTTSTLASQENKEIPRKLFLTVVGNGTVTSPSGINCSTGTCTSDYPRTLPGTSVTLAASPSSGQKFSGWSDSCTGMGTSCTIVMNTSKKVTATFTGMDIPASCGSAHGTTVTTQPVSNLCGSGSTPSPVTDTGTSWSWTCKGNSGNSLVSCSATKAVTPPSPKCGSANGIPSSSMPNATLCEIGTSTGVTLSSSSWVWSCVGGTQSSEKVACSAPVIPSSPSLSTRIQAAQATANNTNINSSCGALNQNVSGGSNGFYWEIGDQNGIIKDTATGLTASGSVYPKAASGPTYTRTLPLLIASASKWIYGSYVVEKTATLGANGVWEIPKQYVPFLNFTSGYTNMTVASCPSAETPTVKDCMNKTNGTVTNGTINPRDVGYFAYNGGHMQVFGGGGDPVIGDANGDALSTAKVFGSSITNTFKSRGVNAEILFSSPMPAGGGFLSAQNYAYLLQGIIRDNSPLVMKYFLRPIGSNPYAVCTSTTDPTCVDANGKRFSHGTPVPSNVSWHYSVGHWIESDPATGDGAYSSAGAFGFYPWIDSTKKYYGILARQDTSSGQQGFRSALCGANIRKAFMTGQVQN